MKTPSIFSIAALGAALALTSPVASAVYKWTDEQGNVHYTQSPPPAGRSGEKLKPPPPIDTDAANKTLKSQGERADAYLKERAKAKDAAAKAKAEAAAKQAKCEQARSAIQKLQTSQRIHRFDEAGNRIRLGTEEIQKQLEALKKIEAETCK